MIVDDDKAIRQMLHMVLSTQSYTVEQAKDGLEALDMVRSLKPDVAVVDIAMPRMSGPATFDPIREIAPTL